MVIHGGLVRGSEQGGGNVGAAESTNHGAGSSKVLSVISKCLTGKQRGINNGITVEEGL
jgi:hypothetical protein